MSQNQVTLKEIAANTGVSLATVHRVIHGKGGVGDETRKRILDEIEKSGYQLNEVASVMKRNQKSVFVVLPKPQEEERFFLRGIWKGIKETAETLRAFKVQFHYIESECKLSEMAVELERVYDQYLDDMDALITIADNEKAAVWVDRFARRGVYTIVISSYYIGDESKANTIKVDHVISGKIAAEFMRYALPKEKGKVLLFCGNSQIYSNRIYAGSFEKELNKCGYDIIKIEGFGRGEIREVAEYHLKNSNIEGIFICNARNTYSVCRILEDLDMGSEIIVIGTDVYEEQRKFFDEGILNAVICQYQWKQGMIAVNSVMDYFNKGIGECVEKIISPVLLLKSNFDCFVDDQR